MNRIAIVFLTFGIIIVLLTNPQSANANPTESDTTKKIGIGFQCAPFPIFGLGVIYNMNEKLGIQGIGRYGLDIDILAVRALYRFRKEPQYVIYADGLLGFFRATNVSEFLFAPETNDEAIGYGIGGGFEYFFKRLPDIGWNVEVDYIYIDFEKKWWEFDYKAFSLIMIGIGIHYYF